MNRPYLPESRQARVAVYAATQPAVNQQRLQDILALSVPLLLWVSLLCR